MSGTPTIRRLPSSHTRQDQFRGVTKMIPHEFPLRIPGAGLYLRTSRQGILDYSNRRRKRVTEESSVVQKVRRSAAGRCFLPLSFIHFHE